jgi:hypothetical protein
VKKKSVMTIFDRAEQVMKVFREQAATLNSDEVSDLSDEVENAMRNHWECMVTDDDDGPRN